MKQYKEFTVDEKAAFRAAALAAYNGYQAQGLKIDMSRGKPAPVQLDLSGDLFHAVDENNYRSADGTDCRNYGGLLGVEETRALFAEILGVEKKNVIACGNASLTLMFDYVAQCMFDGCGAEPWSRQKDVKFIAVVPGYDRHFTIAQYFGIKLINVPMTPTGPDMDKVEELVKDPTVKGMFCVPKYSNPDGYTYSPETIERLAAMTPAAKDFRVIYDNAYIVHDLYEESDYLPEIFSVAKKYGHEDHFVEFASTSKITLAGAGVACIAASDNNIEMIKKRLTVQVISYDKLNQLRHAKVFKSAADVHARMQQHAAILRPKFEAVLEIMEKELGGLGIAHWTKPRGGYFISLYVDGGSAKRVYELCAQAGLTLTNVGATYPYGVDPDDSNIRIAPSFPTVEELKTCAEILCAAVKVACSENA
ncbi:MAG: aminotransferase class I/II-fold pyridoxal phosphate-dependent enzyme [Clostridia bacterium]|nr:aminotransferase class I/II-fold pyridoxal phosphate-dependent enzyme [Clostridia bacterium]